MDRSLPCFCAILALAGSNAWGAPDLPTYSVTDLKALGIWPVAMNQRGEVVGQPCCGSPSAGVLLYTSSAVQDLGLPAGGYSSFVVKAINESAWIVGNARKPSPPGPYYEDPYEVAFHDGSGWTVIDTSSLGRTSNAIGINNAGQVIGNSGPELFMPNTPWLYERGNVVQLGPSSSSFSTAVDISDAGAIVGYLGPDYSPISMWLYRDGEWQELGTQGVVATAVNESGTILAFRPRIPGVGRSAVLWRDGVTSGVPTSGCWPSRPIPLAVDFYAVALNDRDEVAGYGASGAVYACLYSSGASIDLGTLGGNSSRAQSLNNRGQVAGSSFDSQGQIRPFVHADGAMLDVADLEGVGSTLQLGNANELQVTINDGPYLLVVATDTAAEPDTLAAAYLLTPVAPTVTLTAGSVEAPVRTPVTLTWNSQSANSCVATGGVSGDGWAGTRSASGQFAVTSGLPGGVEYVIRCSAGPLSADSRVLVTYAAAPPSLRITATPSVSPVGKAVVIVWSADGADGCTATGGQPGDGWAGVLPTSGRREVIGNKPGVVGYGLKCAAGELTSEAKVSVTFERKSGGGGCVDLLGLLGLLGLGLTRRFISC